MTFSAPPVKRLTTSAPRPYNESSVFPRGDTMIVDFHTHTFPDRIAAGAIASMQKASHSAAFTDGTVGGLQASMRRAGVDASVVLPVATNPLKLRSINDVSVSLTGKDGLIYFGCAHPDAPDLPDELERIADAGLRGVKIHPVYQHTDIDDPRYIRLLTRCGELGLTVVMHAGHDIGFPGEVRCSPEMIIRALDASGPVRLVCAHMGGWRSWDEAAKLADHGVMIDTAFSLGSIVPLDDHYAPDELPMLTDEAFVRLVRTFGADRVLFGTDSPWADQAAELRRIRNLPLMEEEKAAILGGNAEKILNS